MSYSEGIIKQINNHTFFHTASTKSGSSGSPIILKNTSKVIGMHKGAIIDNNLGSFIYPIFKSIKINNEKKFVDENGNYYIGQMENGKHIGKGIIYYKNGKILYEGDFINGKREGFGKFIDKNGDWYIGQWLNGQKHGEGKIYYSNGNLLYEGDFVKGKKEGKGKYIYYKNFP